MKTLSTLADPSQCYTLGQQRPPPPSSQASYSHKQDQSVFCLPLHSSSTRSLLGVRSVRWLSRENRLQGSSCTAKEFQRSTSGLFLQLCGASQPNLSSSGQPALCEALWALQEGPRHSRWFSSCQREGPRALAAGLNPQPPDRLKLLPVQKSQHKASFQGRFSTRLQLPSFSAQPVHADSEGKHSQQNEGDDQAGRLLFFQLGRPGSAEQNTESCSKWFLVVSFTLLHFGEQKIKNASQL